MQAGWPFLIFSSQSPSSTKGDEGTKSESQQLSQWALKFITKHLVFQLSVQLLDCNLSGSAPYVVHQCRLVQWDLFPTLASPSTTSSLLYHMDCSLLRLGNAASANYVQKLKRL